ncbi:MAG TPA: hypothetical protein DIT13_17495 [Verrucomicrobiales bacterium]|nr:hypothetical protein [Verrucomicrobiales bacterium]
MTWAARRDWSTGFFLMRGCCSPHAASYQSPNELAVRFLDRVRGHSRRKPPTNGLLARSLRRRNPCMHYLLSHDPISDTTPPFGPGLGAEARFLGVVRDLEDGRVIAGIEYSAYVPMAEKMLAAIIAEARAAHGGHEVFIQHRLGFVAAAEVSILIRVRARHSAPAFDLCRSYLHAVKTRVPIWKRPAETAA